jgi:hypothetical protein
MHFITGNGLSIKHHAITKHTLSPVIWTDSIFSLGKFIHKPQRGCGT